MEKGNAILLFAVLLAVCNVGYGGTVDAPYEVGTWQGFCPAAVSYTFDDNRPYQHTIAIPMFNQYDFDATFYVVSDWVGGNWTPWQSAAADGHEIGSHTVSHPTLRKNNERTQYETSQNIINANIPGDQCLTIAYPGCRSATESVCAEYYIAGRNCSAGYNPPTPANFYEIKANICGSQGSVNSLADFIAKGEAAVAGGGWQVYLLHDLDDGSGYSPLDSTILQDSLDYLDGLRSTYWVDTFLNVVRYIKERDDVSLTEVSNQGDSITLQITDTLDDVVYNHAVTFRRPLPAGWGSAIVTQNGQQVASSIVVVGSTTYLMFDAVPDGGDVVLLEGSSDSTPPAAPTNLAAAAGVGLVNLNWDENGEVDLASYTVYRSTTQGSDYSEIASGVATSDYIDNTVTSEITYYYVVTAVDIASNESGNSNEASATPQGGSGTNVLTNPGFESGTTGWLSRGCSIEAVTSPVQTGSMSGRAYNRTANWQGIQQDMMGKMVEGATYQVSGYVRTSTSTSSDVRITFQQTDGAGTNYLWAATGTASNSGWTYISGNFTLTVSGTLTELFVYAEGPASGVDIYFDNVVVSSDPTASGAVSVGTRYQIVEGFGAAGAWYQDTLVSLGQSQPVIYDILFGDLGLDIYRLRNAYNQSGGTGYMSDSGTIISNAEASLGRPLKTLICAWSPPANLKSNGDTANGGTLIGGPSNYDYAGYANWWADSITAWSGYGVDADYISIQNEPDYTASWDSCRFDPTEGSVAGYDQAFEAVYNEMFSRFGSTMPKMLGPETTGFNGAAGSTPSDYISALINPSHAYGYAHHLYNIDAGDNPDAYLTAMQNFNAAWGSKPLFQTEYQKTTTTWPDALDIALLLHNSLTVEEVSSYLYFDLFWGTAGSGLVYITPSSYTIYNDYYGFKQYSAFIHSGWQRVDATEDSPDVRMSAYISPDNSEMSVVIINTSSTTAIDLTLSFPGLTILGGQVYRTSQTENCVALGSFDPASALTLPAHTVTTLSLIADTGPDTTPPANPTGLSATAASSSQIDLDWADNGESDLASYNVYEGGVLIASGVASSQYSDTGLAASTTYCYTVTAVDTSSNESAASNESCTTTQSGGGGDTMHVDSIAVAWIAAGGPNRKGQATVVIKDSSGNPVSGATVSGTFSGTLSESGSATTDSNGTAVIQTFGKTKNPSSLTFCVDDVIEASMTYDSGANVVTCGSI